MSTSFISDKIDLSLCTEETSMADYCEKIFGRFHRTVLLHFRACTPLSPQDENRTSLYPKMSKHLIRKKRLKRTSQQQIAEKFELISRDKRNRMIEAKREKGKPLRCIADNKDSSARKHTEKKIHRQCEEINYFADAEPSSIGMMRIAAT